MNKTSQLLVLLALATSPAFAINMEPIDTSLAHFREKGLRPVVILDLDETIIHSTKRKATAYQIALSENRGVLMSEFPTDTTLATQAFAQYGTKLFQGLKNEYDSSELMKKIGITNSAFIKKLDDLMVIQYLGNANLIKLDRPVLGGIRFISYLYNQYADVYFVTSRYMDTQYEGTLANLISNRLFVQGQSHLILRNRGEASVDFKARAFKQIKENIKKDQAVALVGENEPENMNLLTHNFPDALPIFRDGAVLNKSVSLENPAKILHFRTFEWEWH